MWDTLGYLIPAVCIVGLLLVLKKYLPREDGKSGKNVYSGVYDSDIVLDTSRKTVNGRVVTFTKASINGVRFETNKDVAAIRNGIVHFRDGSTLDVTKPEDRDKHPDVTFH